jgi:hypothetical protein
VKSCVSVYRDYSLSTDNIFMCIYEALSMCECYYCEMTLNVGVDVSFYNM